MSSESGPAAQLTAALVNLYEAAGCPKYQVLIQQAAGQQPPVSLSAQSLSDWFGGVSVPSKPAAVRFLVQYLQARAGERDGYQPQTLHWWLGLHDRAQQDKRVGRAGGGNDQGSRRRSQSLGAPRLGRPIGHYLPLTLEVH